MHTGNYLIQTALHSLSIAAEFELRIDSVDVLEDVGSVPFTVLFMSDVTLSAGLEINVLVEVDATGGTAVRNDGELV